MNPDDYGSQPACQRLMKAGIVLEAEWYFRFFDGEVAQVTAWQKKLWEDQASNGHASKEVVFIPALSMAEVCTGLLRQLGKNKYIRFGMSDAGFFADIAFSNYDYREAVRENITDCLIDLLIWITERKRKEK